MTDKTARLFHDRTGRLRQYSMMRMQDTNGILHPFAIFEVQNSGAAVFVCVVCIVLLY